MAWTNNMPKAPKFPSIWFSSSPPYLTWMLSYSFQMTMWWRIFWISVSNGLHYSKHSDFCHDIQISLNRPIFLPRTDRESLGKDRADKQEGDKVQPFLWPVMQNESISLLSKLSAFPIINTISRLPCSLPSDAPEIYLG